MSEHESAGDKPRDIGLKAVREARADRGRTKHGRITPGVMLIAVFAVLTVIAVAWQYRERSLSSQKEELFSKQRAAVASVGKAWFPLRDALEKLTVDAATGDYKGDWLDPAASKWDFRSLPGIYLRMRVEDAKDVASLRKKAKDSARDAFAACLLRENNPSTAARARDEDAGGLGWQDQPWNLRLAYQATNILGDDWLAEAKNAEDEIHFRVFVQQYEKAQKEEIPLAIDIVQKARFFIVVLDEDVPEAREIAARDRPDSGSATPKPLVVTEQQLEQVAHPTRVHILKVDPPGKDRATGETHEMVRLRREVEGDFRFALGNARDPHVLAAVKRQVNGCALAQEIWTAIRAGI